MFYLLGLHSRSRWRCFQTDQTQSTANLRVFTLLGSFVEGFGSEGRYRYWSSKLFEDTAGSNLNRISYFSLVLKRFFVISGTNRRNWDRCWWTTRRKSLGRMNLVWWTRFNEELASLHARAFLYIALSCRHGCTISEIEPVFSASMKNACCLLQTRNTTVYLIKQWYVFRRNKKRF